MKNTATVKSLILLFITCMLADQMPVYARLTDSRNKSNIAYRNHYQRIYAGAGLCFELRNGKLYGWGYNGEGELGIGNTNIQYSPVQTGTDNDWIMVGGVDLHTLAIKSDGTLWAWGYNAYGELGTGNTQQQLSPVQSGNDNHWMDVSAVNFSSMGLKADGTLWVWGSNADSVLGIGNATDQHIPVQLANDHDWVAVSFATVSTIALKANGTLWGWGSSTQGNLGLGDTLPERTPVQIGNDHDWVNFSNGGDYVLAIKADGTLWAWGDNSSGCLGLGDTLDRWVPTQVGTDHDWVMAAAGSASLGLKADGTIWAWGINNYGQLGQGNNNGYSNVPIQVGNSNDWVFAGEAAECMGLKSNGNLQGWGQNVLGQLGLGYANMGVFSPTATGTPATEWVSGAVGGSHTVALRSEGTLWSWGSNDHGQLGTGNNTDQNTPVMSGNDSNWVAVSAGEGHTAALKSNGTLWSWGDNGNGQLGIGNYNDQDNPQQVSGSNWASVSCGSAHSLALKADGTLWAWGDNSSGQLGTGNYSTFNSPVQIGSYDKWLAIAAGGKHSLALKADGSLWAWGRNTEGQLGTGNNTVQLSPVQVGTGDTWVWISAGDQYSLALKADGTLWAWGMNSDGQLGIGNYNNQDSPVQVGAGNDWIAANAGKAHSIAWKVDGTIWSWGNNDYGQLGLGNNTGYNSPQQITQTPIVHIFSGPEADHSGVLKDDRSLICLAGHNDKGQLGDGTLIDKNTFNCINNCVEPGISIAAIPGDTVCSADSTWFVATTSNGGPTPGYQWYKNNQPVGGNNDSLYLAGLNTGDQVYCVLTGSAACNVYPTDTSDTITVVVVQSVTPTITIAADLGDTICQEHVSTYTASITNGGPNPVYQWYENNNPVGTNSNTYVPLQISGNIIKCKLTSSAVCPSPHEVTSAAHTMLIVPVTIPQVTITANPGTAIAQNQSVTFTANVTNATNPQYQWKKNGSNLPGETQQTYTTTTLQNGDQIACRVRGLSECDTALSAPLTMSVWPVNVANVGNASMEVNVYPNPVKEVLQVGYSNITEGQMELCDMAGKVLIQQPLSHSMDMKGLASGVYLLHVLDNATGYDSVHMVVKE